MIVFMNYLRQKIVGLYRSNAFGSKWLLIFFAVGLACVVAFSNIWQHQMVWDDKSFLVDWKSIRTPMEHVDDFFKGDIAPGQEGVYRPMRSVYYSASYSLFGVETFGYRVQSILVHVLASLLLVGICWEVLKSRLWAGMAGLWFGLHPVHVESVSWITASFDTIGFTLGVAGFYLFLVYLRKGKKVWWFGSILMAGLAIFSNEINLVIPGLLVGYEYLVSRKRISAIMRDWWKYLPYVILVLIYFWIRFFVLDIFSREEYMFGSLFSTMVLAFVLMSRYFYLLMVPLKLNINHRISENVNGFYFHDTLTNSAENAPEILDLNVLLSIVIVSGLVWFTVKKRSKFGVEGFGVFWILLSLSPVMQFFPQSIVFSERYLYFSSVGFVLVLAKFFERVSKQKKYLLFKKYKNVCLVSLGLMIALGYGLKTHTRNKVWADEVSLWSVTYESNPNSALAATNLGYGYFLAGEEEKAYKYLKRAVELNPRNTPALSNLGAYEALRGNYDESIEVLEQAVAQSPDFIRGRKNLASTYFDRGDYQKALDMAASVVARDDSDADAYHLMGQSYHGLFIYNLAEENYLKAVALKSDFLDALNSLGNLYFDWGRLDESLEYYEKALVLSPDNPVILEHIEDVRKLQVESSQK